MDEPWDQPGNGTPTVCMVYPSRPYSLVMLCFVLAFAAVCTAGFSHFRPKPGTHAVPAPHFLPHWTLPAVFALLISIGMVALIHSLVTKKLAVRVDELGIRYPRGWVPLIEWADVVSVDRAPKTQRIGSETHSYLRDAWRPVRVTVRNPDKYLNRFQKWGRANFASLVKDAEHAVIQIEFTGMAPGSDVVEACIQQHLARMNGPR